MKLVHQCAALLLLPLRDLSVPPEKFADWARLQGVIGADEAAAGS